MTEMFTTAASATPWQKRSLRQQALRHSRNVRYDSNHYATTATATNYYIVNKRRNKMSRKSAHTTKDSGITGLMAKWYDNNSRKSRLDEMREYADLIGGSIEPGAKVLEVAPGPGYLSVELARRGFAVSGVELSEDFVAIEKRNAAEAGVNIDFRQGNASALPLADGIFDFIVCSAAFKNFARPLDAIKEMHRVLKPGGTALILDMNHNVTDEDIDYEMKKTGMKGFDRWFVKLSFKTFLKRRAYTIEEFENLIAQTAFASQRIVKYSIGLQVWMFKAADSSERQ